MNEFIKMLDINYELLDYKIKDNIIVFEITSIKKSCICPYCGTASSRVHSTYQWEVQDLPIHDKQTVLLVNTRKMFCDNLDCKVTTFAERHPFVTKSRKKTEHLVTNILKIISRDGASTYASAVANPHPHALSLQINDRFI